MLSGLISGGILAASAAILYSIQNTLIYLPNHPSVELKHTENNPQGYRNPMERGIPFENVYLQTKDGLKLHA